LNDDPVLIITVTDYSRIKLKIKLKKTTTKNRRLPDRDISAQNTSANSPLFILPVLLADFRFRRTATNDGTAQEAQFSDGATERTKARRTRQTKSRGVRLPEMDT
jgi:hypothetical protein